MSLHSAAIAQPRPARHMLERAGLRSSLSRLKVLDTLYLQGAFTPRELYLQLSEPGMSITLVCVRQALHRLHRSGLLVRDEARRYRLAPDVIEDLQDVYQPD